MVPSVKKGTPRPHEGDMELPLPTIAAKGGLRPGGAKAKAKPGPRPRPRLPWPWPPLLVRSQKTTKNFKRSKNREDGSDLENFLTKWIAAVKSIFLLFWAIVFEKKCAKT